MKTHRSIRSAATRALNLPADSRPGPIENLRAARAHIDTARIIVASLSSEHPDDGLALIAEDLYRASDTITQLLGLDDLAPTCAVCAAPIPLSVIEAARSRGTVAAYCSPRHRSTATKRRQRKR